MLANWAALSLVLLRIPNPLLNPRIFPSTSKSESANFFAAVSNGFGPYVRESICTYQVAVQATLRNAAAAGRRRCIIGGLRHRKGWGVEL